MSKIDGRNELKTITRDGMSFHSQLTTVVAGFFFFKDFFFFLFFQQWRKGESVRMATWVRNENTQLPLPHFANPERAVKRIVQLESQYSFSTYKESKQWIIVPHHPSKDLQYLLFAKKHNGLSFLSYYLV